MRPLCTLWVFCVFLVSSGISPAQKPKPAKAPEITYPPKLPDNKTVVTDTSPDFLKSPIELKEGVTIAKTPPTIDYLYYPRQDYPGQPWSNWGDSLAVNGKYYASIGDHLAVAAKGNGTYGNGVGLVFEYDPEKKTLRELVDTTKVLNMPKDHYAPGKIHSRLDMGDDGWIYFATHRGSGKATTDQFHYKGDWILRTNPESGKTEVVAHGPVPKHCIPNSVLDPKRLIFYGGTAAGSGDDGIQFFAYDCKNKKMIYSGPDGPARYMIFAKSTGKVYFNPGKGDTTSLMRFDPDKGKPEKIEGTIGIRAATQETPQGIVYTVSQGQGQSSSMLYAFHTKTEKVEELVPAPVGSQAYIATIDADPTGRYVYYNAGAHGGSEKDGTPIVQYDTKTKTKKVIAFLHPFYQNKYGAMLRGTYSMAVDPKGDKLYITWNVSRGSKAWDCCALTVIHIPETERKP